MNPSQSDKLNPTVDGDSRQTGPAESPLAGRFRRGTVLKAVGAALIGGVLGGSAWPKALEAKRRPKKRRKKRTPKPRPTPQRPPIVLSKTFSNRARIRLDDNARANPYPSPLQISGLNGTSVLDVNVVLHDLSHGRPVDLGAILVAPSGRGVAVMYKAGGNLPVTNAVITIDDQAARSMPYMVGETLATGTFKPSIYDNPAGAFPTPAPGSVGFALSDFYGENPNGEWNLFIYDDTALSAGELATGWSLVITYQAPAPVPPKPKPPKARRRRTD